MGDDFDFDSGDDLFDGVTAEELVSDSPHAKRTRQDDLQSSPATSKRPRLSPPSEKPPAADGDPGALELARNILSQKFGYSAFRHEQEGAIAKVLQGKSSLVIFPTGAGKSLCYQVGRVAFAASPGAGLTRCRSPPSHSQRWTRSRERETRQTRASRSWCLLSSRS